MSKPTSRIDNQNKRIRDHLANEPKTKSEKLRLKLARENALLTRNWRKVYNKDATEIPPLRFWSDVGIYKKPEPIRRRLALNEEATKARTTRKLKKEYPKSAITEAQREMHAVDHVHLEDHLKDKMTLKEKIEKVNAPPKRGRGRPPKNPSNA